MSPRAAQTCGICERVVSKYKCPSCLLPYCSVDCFKKHKEIPCVEPSSTEEKPATSTAKEVSVETTNVVEKSEDKASGSGSAACATQEVQVAVEEAKHVVEKTKLEATGASATKEVPVARPIIVDEAKYVVEKTELEAIASSSEIREALKDEALQKLITNIDSSSNPLKVKAHLRTSYIVSCGFVKDLVIDQALGEVSFRLELTTPACPVKDMFEKQANEVVAVLQWVKKVNVTMSAQPAKPIFAGQLPPGLSRISSIVAVSSCKGGVGKSTVAVNLAYTLAGMGARVGIFDADVYGPSLPTMVNPDSRILEMDPEKKTIIPTEYLGVKLVSFGFAGQGRAIMRGPMVSGVINQLLTTTEWGELDYLVIDMPPGTGDIQLTLCQVAPLTAAVIVTTPQKLAFIDVAKGVRMFSKLKVPCVAVVENMCHFDADGKRYYPFGKGSGSQVVQQFGIPHLFDLPIRPTLSASGDSGVPEVVSDPLSEVARTFQDLGVCVVQQCAKIRQQVSTAVTYDKYLKAIRVKVPNSDEEFLLHPATVRRNDRSAQSVDEWTGEQKIQFGDVAEDIEPEEIRPMGNYAVSITWPDGFSQIAPYDQLETIERLVDVPPLSPVEV